MSENVVRKKVIVFVSENLQKEGQLCGTGQRQHWSPSRCQGGEERCVIWEADATTMPRQ